MAFRLDRINHVELAGGLEPEDWKFFDDVGAGTREIRIREATGAFRMMYVAKLEQIAIQPFGAAP